MRVSLADPVSYTLPYDRSLAAALARRGHEVDLLCATFAHGSQAPPEGFSQHEVFFTRSTRLLRRSPRSRLRLVVKGLDYLPSVRRLTRTIRELDPDVLHLQWLGLPRYDLRWLREAARERPVVFTAHDVLPRRTEHQLDLWQRVFATFDRVVVHSESAAERLADLGLADDRVAVIIHPVFPPPADRPIRPPRGRTLLFFGLIRESKGLDVLLRALPAIADRLPDVRLVVAGDPLEPVAPLEALAAELDVAERVDWRLGYLPDDDVPELMDEAAAVVLPYRKIESSGVLATALGHGRPAVVADVGSLGETVRRFGAGAVVPPEDPAALAAACAGLLGDDAALERAFHGTEAARAALGWDESARAHEQVYEDVVTARSGHVEDESSSLHRGVSESP